MKFVASIIAVSIIAAASIAATDEAGPAISLRADIQALCELEV